MLHPGSEYPVRRYRSDCDTCLAPPGESGAPYSGRGIHSHLLSYVEVSHRQRHTAEVGNVSVYVYLSVYLCMPPPPLSRPSLNRCAESKRLHNFSFSKTKDACVDCSTRGCRAIANIPWNNSTYQDPLGEAGAARVLADAMTSFPTDRNILLYACRGIANLACDHQGNQERLRQVSGLDLICKAMKKFGEDKDIQWYGSGAIANCALNYTTNINALGELGACELVASSMERFPKDRNTQLQGLRGVVTLTKSCPSNQEKLGEARACQLTCAAMDSFPEDESILTYGCKAIDHLSCDNSKNIQTFVNSGACKLACRALKSFPDSRECVLQALRAVVALAWNRSLYKQLLGEGGACRLVGSALQKFSEDREITLYGIEAVANLSWNDQNNQHELEVAKVPLAITRALQKWPQDVALLCESARGISNLCYHNSNIQKTFSDSSVSTLLCDGIRWASSDRGAQLYGVRAILNLAYKMKLNQDSLHEAGACSIVMDAFQRFPSDKAIPADCCRGIAHLAWQHPRNQEALFQVGALQLLIQQMRRLMDDKGVQVFGVRAIYSMTDYLPAMPILIELKTGSMLGSLLKKMPDEKEAVTEILEIFSRLISCQEDQIEEVVAAVGGAELLLRSIQPVGQRRDTEKAGWSVLSKLIRHKKEAYKQELVDGGVVALTTQAMAFYSDSRDQGLVLILLKVVGELACEDPVVREALNPCCKAISSILESGIIDDREVQYECIKALSNMCEDDANNKLALLTEQGSSNLVEILATSAHDLDIQLAALEAIMILCCENPEGQTFLGSAGACKVVCDAISKNAAHGGVQALAVAAIVTLSSGHSDNQQRFVEVGVEDALLMAMTSLREDLTVQSSCCRALAG